jgi:hypothetical protein
MTRDDILINHVMVSVTGDHGRLIIIYSARLKVNWCVLIRKTVSGNFSCGAAVWTLYELLV